MDVGPNSTDAKADWAVTQAFFDGGDPYEPISRLADQYGVDFTSPVPGADPPHPRLPGAFLVLSPLLSTSVDGADDAMRALGVIAVVAVAGVYAYSVRSRGLLVIALPILLTLTGAAIWGFAWFTQSPVLVLPLAVAGLLAYREKLLWLAALLIGVSALLKPILLILFVGFLRTKRWLEALVGMGAFLVVNLVGFGFGSVDPVDVLGALEQTSAAWFSTGPNLAAAAWLESLVPISTWVILGFATLFVGAVWVSLRNRIGALHIEMAMWGSVGLLASPLSWPHYLLMIIPLLWLVLASDSAHAVAKVIIVLGLLPWVWAQPTSMYFAGLLIVAAGCVAAVALSTDDAALPMSVTT